MPAAMPTPTRRTYGNQRGSWSSDAPSEPGRLDLSLVPDPAYVDGAPPETRVRRAGSAREGGADPPDYFRRIDAKKSIARGSFDWPSQNIAWRRTAGVLLARATSISFGTP